MTSSLVRRTAGALSLVAVLWINASRVSAQVDFGRDVLPILSDKCFFWHGPDAKARKAALRLDMKDGLYRTRDGVTVVDPGKSSESELVRRISSKDDDERMPPPGSNRK